jgi:choline kinase
VRAVILAAGDGGRLGRHTATVPKPLIPVVGRPLVAYTLDALESAGLESAVVVAGYRAAQLRAGLGRRPRLHITFVVNPRFVTGASLSLRAARPLLGDEPFLLLMADHMLSPAIIEHLLRAYVPGGPSIVAADASPWPGDYAEEATHIRFAPGGRLVSRIGKGLEPYDALDTGAFLLGPEVWTAVDASPEDCELSVIFSELARRGQLAGVDVSGASWYDIDTAADLEADSRLFAVESAG